MDIAAWLQGLGLGRYEPAFRENEIDVEVLPELTESDLSALGLPIGPRRKLLKAIAALREGAALAARLPNPPLPVPGQPAPVSSTGQALAGGPGDDPGTAREGRVGAEAERRQLTPVCG